MEEQKLVRAKKVAEYLSVSEKTIYQWAELRRIPHYKINGCLRFRLEEVLHHLETCKVNPRTGKDLGDRDTTNRKGVN